MSEVIPGWKTGVFPDWTLKHKDKLHEIVEKVKQIATQARLEGKPMPVYNDWRDYFSFAFYWEKEIVEMESRRPQRNLGNFRRDADPDGCKETKKRPSRKGRKLAQ